MAQTEEREQIERVGTRWSLAAMLDVRRRTRAAIARIAAAIHPGMVEEDAVTMARAMLKEDGLLRGWHGTYVRFGPNTVKIYGAASQPGVVLRENDIFLIDIGPIHNGCEGDGGDTFTVGDDADMGRCAQDARRLFDIVRLKWREESTTGAALYAYASQEARRMGWELNLDLQGHRLSDFPHALIHNGTLAAIDFAPAARLWVLEIHIRHPDGLYGAFYEDLLLDEESIG